MLKARMVILAVGCFLTAGAAAGQDDWDRLPPGTWMSSCQYPEIQDGVLTAFCQREFGTRRHSSIDLRDCDGGPVSNRDGQLICDGYGSSGGSGGALPRGSWRQSCRDGEVRSGILTAECRDGNGGWTDARLNLRNCPDGPVANDDGELRCGGGGGGSGGDGGGKLPGGSWRQSCRDGEVRSGVLFADCRRGNGRWQEARLSLRNCPDGPVANDDGELLCERDAGGQLPSGSWRQTCRDGWMDGNTLRAECRRSDGRWRDARLPMRDCRRDRAGNEDGRLFCE